MADPNNSHRPENPVGRFMVAAGAVIELRDTGKILLTRRSTDQDWQAEQWEVLYGRIDQGESVEQGLKREAREETGITDLEIIRILTTWHIYRGSERPENEVIGITHHARTQTETIQLSHEHAEYRWVTPEEALELISVEGIRRDIQAFQQSGK